MDKTIKDAVNTLKEFCAGQNGCVSPEGTICPLFYICNEQGDLPFDQWDPDHEYSDEEKANIIKEELG